MRVAIASTLTACILIGSIGSIVVLTGCQMPGRILSAQSSRTCPTCRTETRTAALEDVSYETHVCVSCRTVSRLVDLESNASDRDIVEGGQLRVSTPMMHVCDSCKAVVGVCSQCRQESEKTQAKRGWLPWQR